MKNHHVDSSIPRLFGTDGIRGKASRHPMTAETILRLGRAAGFVFRTDERRRHTIVIGKDTRLSGDFFESALEAGLTSMGIHVLQVGVLPTPAIAYLTRAFRADAGIVISASHNPFDDNGIKFFWSNGMKLPDRLEREIERVLHLGLMDAEEAAPPADRLGRAVAMGDATGRYIEFCKNAFPRSLCLDGLKIVVDCANGAAFRVAPSVLWELGADLVVMGNAPNGLNINEGCGSLHPERLSQRVLAEEADVGLAFDGDADRLMVCDEKGNVLNGDHILAMNALAMKGKGTLKGGGVVGTVMSNLGLERFLLGQGLSLQRAQVGDRHVLEMMIAGSFNLGGEQSGHLIFLDHNTTGDGLISALQVLSLLAEKQAPLSTFGQPYADVPQVLKNVRTAPGVDPMALPQVQAAMQAAERHLAGSGRLLVRKSGTEPLVRVMAEGDDAGLIESLTDDLCRVIGQGSGVIGGA